MGIFIRKLFQSSVPNIRRKAKRAKNENDLIAFLSQYFSLNQTTIDEVKAFLRDNQISFNETIQSMQTHALVEELQIELPGPAVWQSFFPFGSHYHVQFSFVSNILVSIKAFHIVYHF